MLTLTSISSATPPSEALVKLLERADRRNPDAQFELGKHYAGHLGYTGLVDRDPVRARNHYFDAAYQGHGKAMNNLGIMHLLGDGGSKDQERAFYWLTKASKADVPQAKISIAVLQLMGQYSGGEEGALENIKSAAKLGFGRAKTIIDIIDNSDASLRTAFSATKTTLREIEDVYSPPSGSIEGFTFRQGIGRDLPKPVTAAAAKATIG